MLSDWSGAVVLAAMLAGCHGEAPHAPLKYEVFGPVENFFDVKFLAPGRAVASGVGGRIFGISEIAAGETGAKVEVLAKLERPEGAETNPQVTRLKFVDDTEGWGVGQAGLIVHTTDGGKTWERQDSGVTKYLFDVDFIDKNKGWAGGEGSTLLATSDGGKNWQLMPVPMSQIGIPPSMGLALESPTFYAVDFLDAQTGWVAGEYGQINITRDGGKTWEAQHGGLLGGVRRDLMFLPTFQCLRFYDASNGVAVGTAQGKGILGGIAFTKDGGATWQFADAPSDSPFYDIGWTPDGNSILIGASGEALVGNGTTGWKDLTMPPGTYAPLAAIGFDPNGHGIIIGTHGTMLASGDFGKKWTRVQVQ